MLLQTIHVKMARTKQIGIKKPSVNKPKAKKPGTNGKNTKAVKKPASNKISAKKPVKKSIVEELTEAQFHNSSKGFFWIGPYNCLVPNKFHSVVAKDGMNTLSINNGGITKETANVSIKGLEMTRLKYLKLYCYKCPDGIWLYKGSNSNTTL